MHKLVKIFLITISMLCVSMSGAVGSLSFSKTRENQNNINPVNNINTNDQEIYQTFSKYATNKEKIITQTNTKEIDLPWIDENSNLLEWWIRLKYNGVTFQEEVPVDITDFKEKFLKHPEYGEIIYFDVDDDPENDIQVIVGFYWSIIKQPDGSEVKSLEKRFRVRQLETGNYIDDQDAELEVWSELHINYGLFKKASNREKSVSNPLILKYKEIRERIENRISTRFRIINLLLNKLDTLVENIESNLAKYTYIDENKSVMTSVDNSDYISVGSGYRSPAGEDVPRYTEKRYAFARESIFSPTIFQHMMDPGSSKGKGPFETLYGFQAYQGGSTTPSYDIAFSVEFDPCVYLKTKFIPLDGYIYYYYEDESKISQETKVSFAADILSGAGPNDEGAQLSLIFDEIDDSLGQTGRWMSFDIEAIGDNDLLAGKFSYEASEKFTVGVVIDSPSFEEKIEFVGIPKSVDVEWDLDFNVGISPVYGHADGFVDLSMSSNLDGINIYYPKNDPYAEDVIFIDVPGGVPRSSRIDAAATLSFGDDGFSDQNSFFSGMISHDCSSNFECIEAFLPEEDIPIVKVTEIPSYSEASGKLYWNQLKGNAYMWRSSSGPKDPIEVNLEYAGFKIYDHLEIRNGHIDTRFKAATDGYFDFDTSDRMFANTLDLTTPGQDSLFLNVDEVSADNLETEWDISTSGGQLQINDLKFSGIIDTLNDLELNLNLQGKTADLNLDWVLADQGNFAIEVNQANDLTLDFNDLFPEETDSYVMDGGITLSNNLVFDMEWKLDMGESAANPGYIRINKYNDNSNIKDFDVYFTLKNSEGEEAFGFDIYFKNPQIYLDLEWYFDLDDIWPPYIYYWLDSEFYADVKDVKLLWTDLWPNSDTYGEHYWIEVI